MESALNQTHRPIEVIVVDDGSTDSSLEVLRSFGGSIILETGPNRGGNAARNRAFALSSGEYIQYLDADDYILPEKIERQERFLEETKADAVYGDWRHRHHLPDGTSFLGRVEVPGSQNDVLESLLGTWWVSPAAILFRRDAIVRGGAWDETLKAAQDRDFFTRVAFVGATILYQSGCYSVYRRYGNVTVSTSNTLLCIDNHCLVLEKAENLLLKVGKLSPAYRHALARSYFLLTRIVYELDQSRYRRLLQKVFSLAPEFRPEVSLPYRLLQRIFGFETAEKLAGLNRRLMARFRSKTA